jgi:hypothetical protein
MTHYLPWRSRCFHSSLDLLILLGWYMIQMRKRELNNVVCTVFAFFWGGGGGIPRIVTPCVPF